jgi:hypothetical protein
MKKSLKILFILLVFFSCETGNNKDVKDGIAENKQDYYFEGMYVPFKLTADLSALSEKEKDMIPLLIEAADIMDRLFWQEAYGKKDSLFELPLDRPLLDFARINYGPWDRLNDNRPFIEGVGDKPRGANFYPARYDQGGIRTRLSFPARIICIP